MPPLLAFLAFGVLWSTLPPDHQTLRIDGLSAPVDITIDGDGVPRIVAASEKDAATAVGFLHARDRMFQMELMRRAASGRLSELVGPAPLPIDKQMRVFGLAHLAEGDVAAQSPETQAVLRAYAAGVNAWIDTRGRFASLEFLFIGKPEPWKPSDSLLWGRTMSLWLSSNYRTELSRQALLGKIPRAMVEQLWPPHPNALPPQASLSGLPGSAAALSILAALPAFPAPFTLPSTASDEWAVDGRWSSTGAPLLAGDPHLSFEFPSLWYLVRVETPGQVLAGATGPGVPFLVLGRNSKIAWSFTTTGADTQDVYLEPPEATFSSHEERIKVRGQPDVVLTVRETRHGPVISDLYGKTGEVGPSGSAKDEPAVAVAMANLQPRDTGATGLLALNHARTVEEAGAAAPLIASPVQNLLVADPSKIALFVTGRVPIRRAGDGWAPVPGVTPVSSAPGSSDDAYGWTGFASGNALPHVVAPASGHLLNGNEPVWPPGFPVQMGLDTFSDWRARRIRTLLETTPKHSVSDFAAMQTDVASTYAAALLPRLRGVPGAVALLRDWDGAMTLNAAQPLIFNAWMNAFHHAVLDKAGIPFSASGPSFEFVPFMLSPEGAHWCGGDCASLLKSTLDSTISSLSERFGADPSAWRWGAVHQASFAHPFLRQIPVIGALATPRIAVPGDGSTLDRGGTNDALEAVHGASYRGVYDLADLDRSRFVVVPGQSGNPLSRHARDFLTRWRDGAMILMGSNPGEVSATVRLEP
jgi:penicillin amidase